MKNSNYHESGQRVKFHLNYLKGVIKEYAFCQEMAHGLELLEDMGLTPPLPDGKRCGNIAYRIPDGMIVSKSGRTTKKLKMNDFVKIIDFDKTLWQAKYISDSPFIKPSSDTPLYWMALVEAPLIMKWKKSPKVALHAHAFATDKAAKKLNAPISQTRTDLSTPEDQNALFELLKAYPYPHNKFYIRRDHGFFVLGETFQDVLDLITNAIKLNQYPEINS